MGQFLFCWLALQMIDRFIWPYFSMGDSLRGVTTLVVDIAVGLVEICLLLCRICSPALCWVALVLDCRVLGVGCRWGMCWRHHQSILSGTR